ncbi:helix-turn-helix transcriptional regulator [Actinomadura chibensis]|uniref:DNA-binding protein n=2 Tax=Actinomadura TaxID=1988 RepID=A0A5D0NU28_9ACTN|nr:helix-turn-helix domain-containing protein [Actinomadura chibensis]TYB47865.1 DNA-binding protein [Actinomadura chibensis]TYK53072.1 DNA-binding protein [Actinomadura decatromicini]
MAHRQPNWLTVRQILDDLDIPRRTWQQWRALGRTPPCKRLPNGELRIRRTDYESWLDSLEEVDVR